METGLKVMSWIGIIIGALALLGSVESGDGYAFIGGAFFIAFGWMTLLYIAENNKKA